MNYKGMNLDSVSRGIYCINNMDDDFGVLNVTGRFSNYEYEFVLERDYRDVKISIIDKSILQRHTYEEDIIVPRTYKIELPNGVLEVTLTEWCEDEYVEPVVFKTLFIIPKLDLWWNFCTEQWETIGDKKLERVCTWNHIGVLGENPLEMIVNVQYEGREGTPVVLSLFDEDNFYSLDNAESIDWNKGITLIVNNYEMYVDFDTTPQHKSIMPVFYSKSEVLDFISAIEELELLEISKTPVEILHKENYTSIHSQKVIKTELRGGELTLFVEDGNRWAIVTEGMNSPLPALAVEGDIAGELLTKVELVDGKVILYGTTKRMVVTGKEQEIKTFFFLVA